MTDEITLDVWREELKVQMDRRLYLESTILGLQTELGWLLARIELLNKLMALEAKS